MADCLKAAMHVEHICKELGLELDPKLEVRVDAAAAIGFARSVSGHKRMKHLDLRAGWIQQLRDTSLADFVKVDGSINRADFFTKLFTRVRFCEEERQLMARLPSDQGRLHK